MKESRRAQRMRERNAKKGRVASMNMISLMDIFTILVFFLLVNSSAVETLPSAKQLQLPEAFEDTKAGETVSVMITRTDILVNGEPAMTVADAEAAERLDAVRAKLESVPKELLRYADGTETEARGEVTVLADRSIPYKVIRRVMMACTEAEYAAISLAILQKTEVESGSDA